MGRGLKALHAAHLAGCKRYLFHDQPIPGWFIKSTATPTLIMFMRGFYIRVLWVSRAQMEELYMLGYQAYNIVASGKPRFWKPAPEQAEQKGHLQITELPQCSHLSNMARGFCKLFLRSPQYAGRPGDGGIVIPVRSLEQQIGLCLLNARPGSTTRAKSTTST